MATTTKRQLLLFGLALLVLSVTTTVAASAASTGTTAEHLEDLLAHSVAANSKHVPHSTNSAVHDDVHAAAAAAAAVDEDTPHQHHHSQQCGVYLAPSTIPGAGLGMFAGVARSIDDVVTTGDVVVPIQEKTWHNGYNNKDDIIFLWDEYTWSAHTFPGMLEEGEDVSGASFGIGAAVNCFFSLVNTMDSWTVLGSANGISRQDPGAGAFTPHYDRKSTAVKDIEAGAELFVDYGYDYFAGREDIYGLIPSLEDYVLADVMLQSLVELRDDVLVVPSSLENVCKAGNEQDNDNESVCTTASDDSSNTTASVVVLMDDLYQVILHMVKDTRIAQTLPDTADEIDVLLQAGGTGQRFYNRSIRDLDWLQENGQCMDHIAAFNSTLPHAGRGAAATRFLQAGSVVAPAPLIHVDDREQMTMYDALQQYHVVVDEEDDDNGGHLRRNVSAPIHHQLLLNYCFGHADSTLLLCPYGALTGLINHSSDKPNVKIVWSDTTFMRHGEWLDMPIADWADEWHSGLSLDYVALRDIAQGEEVLLDYGDEWENAWQAHLAAWEPPPRAESYRPAYELDDDVDLVLQTVYEDPFDDEHDQHFNLLCHEAYRLIGGRDPNDWDNEEMYPCRVVDRFVSATTGETLYTAELLEEVDDWETCENEVWEVLLAVPRDAFLFEDKYYSRDHAQIWSFRHDMRIPDEIFPEAWRNNRD